MPIAFQCVCGKSYKVPDEAAGRKLKCKECGKSLQVPRPGAKKSAKKRSKASDDDDIFSMDLGLDVETTPSELPPRRRTGEAPQKKRKSADSKKQGANKGLIVGVGIASFLVAGVGGFFAVQAIMGTGTGGANQAPEQINYSTLKHEKGGFSIKYPSDWTADQGDKVPHASFTDNTAYVSFRNNEKGGAISSMASLPSGGQIIPGAELEDEPPAKSVHEFMGETVYSNDYSDFEELPGREFQTPFGAGWLSEFTGKEGLGSRIKAYRLTLPGGTYQYNVICKCPARKWDEYEPIFMEMLKSISR